MGAVEASYYARKKEIVQKIGLGVPIKKSYNSKRDKIEDTILIGPHLADERFIKGEFDNEFPDINEETLTNYKQSLQF